MALNVGYPKYYRKEFAGGLARFYDIIFLITSLGLENGARKKILDFISGKDKRILDLATGTGSSAVIIKNRFDNSKVYGVDLSENMLEIARKKNKDIKFSLQNIEKTDFKPDSFDIVTISFGLHEIPLENRHKTMKEAHRLLKRNGKLIILDFYTPRNIFLKALFLLFIKVAEPYGKSFLKQKLVKDLKKYDFKKVKEINYYNGLFQIVYGVK